MDKKLNSIILTGFRATGKSLIGRMLATALGYAFVDTDTVISDRQGASISAMVAQHGWPYFRQLERQMLEECSQMRQAVIATGGGAIEHTSEWIELRRHGYVIWLEAPAEVIYQRMHADNNTSSQRPALTDSSQLEEIGQMLARRTSMYAAGADLRLETATANPEALVAVILQHLRQKQQVTA